MAAIDFNKITYLPIQGSLKSVAEGTHLGDIDAKMLIDITLVLRYEKQPEAFRANYSVKTRQVFTQQFHASKEDIRIVKSFAKHFGLTITKMLPEQRIIQLQGTADAFSKAFHVKLFSCKAENGFVFRARSGYIQLPEPLLPVIEAILGLDNRPLATPKYRIAKKKQSIISHSAAPQGFYSNQLADIYDFPENFTGKDQCIALIELGGGYRTDDISAYFTQLGLPVPTVSSVSIDGG